MRAVVAAFLAPFLIATPLTQVLAQTGQQGPRVVQTDDFRVTIPIPTRRMLGINRFRDGIGFPVDYQAGDVAVNGLGCGINGLLQ